MKVIWLGQNGLLFVSGKNKVLVDPYLSDSLHDIDIRMERGWSINKKFHTVEPDVIVLTNSHLDHTDLPTLRMYIERNKRQVTLLCCESAFNIIAQSGIIGRYNNVLMECGSEWTHDNLVFEAVPAKTDDKTAIGVVITDNADGKKYYITSDTLYNNNIFRHIPAKIDTLFLPINGEDGGMNTDDAIRFAKRIEAAHTVPVHFGMFDDVNPRKFIMDGAVVPTIYKILPLDDASASECSRMSLRKLFAAEEREMKLRLSDKRLIVSDSKISYEDMPTPEGCIKVEEPTVESNEGIREELREEIKEEIKVEIKEEIKAELRAEAKEEKAQVCNENKGMYEAFTPVLTVNEEKTEPATPAENLQEAPVEEPAPIMAEPVQEPTFTEEPIAEEEEISVDDTEEPEIVIVEDIFEDFDDTSEVDVVVVEELSEEPEETEEPEERTPWSYNPYDNEDFEGTLEVDSLRCAPAMESLESMQEQAEEEYDNVDGDEDEYEPYDDSETEIDISDISKAEYTEEDEAEEYCRPEEADVDETETEAEIEEFEYEEESDTEPSEDELPPFDLDDSNREEPEPSAYSDIWVDEDDAAEMSEESEYENAPEYEEIPDTVDEFVPDTEESEEPDTEPEREEMDADSELIYSDEKEEEKPEEDEMAGFEAYDDGDMSDKIDAYVKELEKFERGDTVDFSKLEF